MKADELIEGLRKMIEHLDKQYAIKKKEVDDADIENKAHLQGALNIAADNIFKFKYSVQETLKLNTIDYAMTFSDCAHTSNAIVTEILAIKVVGSPANEGGNF